MNLESWLHAGSPTVSTWSRPVSERSGNQPDREINAAQFITVDRGPVARPSPAGRPRVSLVLVTNYTSHESQ
ncbi:hypothetical protein BaRGS_00019093 [Batillaria attramentaria]|uniref:Uncharacterized protein n=1 Tax=Batillaria attramentaria TaxID=370345 RepID=A0ABD0KR12_9CAEN